MATLWAWATPTPYPNSPVDHTWVTDYDNRQNPPTSIAAVISASLNYWFCWGAFHAQGNAPQVPQGYLGSQAGSVPFATCLCGSNAPSSRNPPTCGTIFTYGVDGVCHQLANQVLWATGSSSSGPLTVALARGYGASTFFYGTYGLQHAAWAARKASCVTTPASGAGSAKSMSRSPTPDDDEFGAKATSALAKRGSATKLAALLTLRKEAQAELLGAPVEMRSALSLNQLHRAFLERAAALLDEQEFAEIFGISKADIANVDLVDPSQFGGTTAQT